jgi:hypothetical protein
VLVDQRSALAEILDVAPVGLGNAVNSYNAASGTLDVRANLNELTQPPLVMVCNLLKQGSSAVPVALTDACKNIAGLTNGLVPLPSIAQVVQSANSGQLPPLPLPIAGQLYGTAAK